MSGDYRKLAGQRRGFFQGASLWLGTDHLLSVRSLRFREEYKRFYLRDIQAIVVAEGPRFHISTRSAVIATVWLGAYLVVRGRAEWASIALWTVAAGLVSAWLYLSAACSCSCRIHTAVSRDKLPSIYRRWTARQFLEDVEPRIRELQGALEANWWEIADQRLASTAAPARTEAAVEQPAQPRKNYTWISSIFLASIFADAALNLLTLRNPSRAAEWASYVLAVVEIGGAIGIFLQYHHGVLRAAMQRLAIVALISMGGIFYVRQILTGMTMGNSPGAADPAVLAALPSYTVLRQVDAGNCLALGLVGVVLMFLPRRDAV